jgi:hypothetical protein
MWKFTVDLKDYKVKVAQHRNTLATQTQRAVRIGLGTGAMFARTHHPHKKRTGLLTSESMLFGKLKYAGGDGAWGYLENLTPYTRFVEFGTEAHTIAPRDYSREGGPRITVGPRRGRVAKGYTAGAGRGSALRFRIGSSVIFAPDVEHPGSRALPFMAPAGMYAGQVVYDELNGTAMRALRDVWK